jgi:hypothetical protein
MTIPRSSPFAARLLPTAPQSSLLISLMISETQEGGPPKRHSMPFVLSECRRLPQFTIHLVDDFGKRRRRWHLNAGGRYVRRKQTTDDILSIVVADLFARGEPRQDASPVIRSWATSGVTGRIELVPFEDRVECTYRRVIGERPPEERRYVIHVSATRPNYGGRRLWLHCARPSCQRRSGRLFLDDPYFVCRLCAGVHYSSQTHPKPRHVKRVERAKAIRTELGGRPVRHDPPPDRPKGMHRATYERLRQELLEIEQAEDERIDEAFRRGEGELSVLDYFQDKIGRSLRDR